MPDDQQQQEQTPPVNLSDPAALTAAYQKYLEYLQQVGNQRPAQAPQVSQASIEANAPTSLLGQIGEGLAGGPPSDVPMTADQRERAGLRGLFNFSRGLLGTGTFDTIGQALARGETEAERGQYSQEAQIGYQQAAAQDWQRQQMADRLAALKESIPLLQGIQRLNMPSLYGPGGGPGSQAGTTPGTVPGAPDIYSLPKAQFLQAVAQRESGGNPTILNYVARADPTAYARGATASGKYQMVNSTWLTAAKAAGIDTTKYPTAMSAPEALQDKAASALYDMQGTAPWNPAKFGANWVQQPGGGYQLVKGAPYTAPSGQQPPAQQPPQQPPAQPATKPPAQGGGGDTAALPLPPVAPPGAVPTVSTPEEAAATAKAVGTYVQVPGTEGQYAKPEGGVTSTPPLIMPGTQTASLTPVVPVTPGPQPPPGVVTPPPQQPPAQQPPAQQPPPPQAPDTKAQNPDGTYVVPDEKLSLPQFQDRYRHVYSPAELQQRGLVLPDNPTAVQTAYAGVQEAEAEARAARQTVDQAQRGLLPGADVAKAIDAANGADKNAQAARQAYTTLIQGANEKNASALQTAYQDQDKNLAAAHKDILDRVAASALETQRGQQQLNQSEVGAANSVWQKTVETANAKAGAARSVRDQLEPAMGLVGAQSTSAFVRNLLQNDPNAATYLKTLGIVDPDKVDATTALRGILSYISSEMKPTGTGALREYEFNAIQNALSSGSMSLKDQRLAMARILNLQDRVIQEGDATGELWGSAMESGNPRTGLGSIQKNIDARLGPIIHNAVKEMPAADLADPAKVGAWVKSGIVRPGRPVTVPVYNDDGSLARNSDGSIKTEMKVVQ